MKRRLIFSSSNVECRGRVAQSVQCLTMDWTTGRSGFDLRQRQEVFSVTSVSRSALGPTQPPVQWALGGHFPVGKAQPGRDADNSPRLVPRS
jgi:hypothetical protein